MNKPLLDVYIYIENGGEQDENTLWERLIEIGECFLKAPALESLRIEQCGAFDLPEKNDSFEEIIRVKHRHRRTESRFSCMSILYNHHCAIWKINLHSYVRKAPVHLLHYIKPPKILTGYIRLLSKYPMLMVLSPTQHLHAMECVVFEAVVSRKISKVA